MELIGTQSQMDAVQQEKRIVDAENADVRQQLKQHDDQISQQHEIVARLKEDNHMLKSNADPLHNELLNLRENKRTLQDQLENVENERDDALNRCEEATTAREKSEKQTSHYQAKWVTTTQELNALHEEHTTAVNERDTLAAESERLNTELISTQKTLEGTSDERDQLSTKCTSLESELETLQGKHVTTSEEKAALSKEFEELQTRFVQLTTNHQEVTRELEVSVATAERTHKELKSAQQELKKAKLAHTQETTKLEDEKVTELQTRLNDLQAELSSVRVDRDNKTAKVEKLEARLVAQAAAEQAAKAAAEAVESARAKKLPKPPSHRRTSTASRPIHTASKLVKKRPASGMSPKKTASSRLGSSRLKSGSKLKPPTSGRRVSTSSSSESTPLSTGRKVATRKKNVSSIGTKKKRVVRKKSVSSIGTKKAVAAVAAPKTEEIPSYHVAVDAVEHNVVDKAISPQPKVAKKKLLSAPKTSTRPRKPSVNSRQRFGFKA